MGFFEDLQQILSDFETSILEDVQKEVQAELSIIAEKPVEDYVVPYMNVQNVDGVLKNMNGDNLRTISDVAQDRYFFGANDWTDIVKNKGDGSRCYYDESKGGVIFSEGFFGKLDVRIPIVKGEKYYAKVRFRLLNGDGKTYIGADSLDNDYNAIRTDKATSYNYFGIIGGNVSLRVNESYTAYGEIGGYNTEDEGDRKKFDPGAKFFNLVIGCNYQGEGETLIESVEVGRVDNKLDFLLIKNGKSINLATDTVDDIALKQGYDLFCPHSKEEYETARLYLLSIGEPTAMGPLGIYKDDDDDDDDDFTDSALNSTEMGSRGWKVKDGSSEWWAADSISDTTNQRFDRSPMNEPNGDYVGKAFLGIWYDDQGYIKHYNDGNDSYKYTTYLCVRRK